MMARFALVRSSTSIILAAASAVGCGGYSATNTNVAPTNQIDVLATQAFSPSALTIRPGESVTFVFHAVGETVTFDSTLGAPADIGTAASPMANASVSRTFGSQGTFNFHSTVHPSMTGFVVVSASAVIPPPPPPPPSPYGERRP